MIVRFFFQGDVIEPVEVVGFDLPTHCFLQREDFQHADTQCI